MDAMAQQSIVGREDEVARLRAGLDAARAGHPTVVLVLGEPGVGKSSLLAAALTGSGTAAATPAMPAPTSAVTVTASGDEAEVDLEYGILDQLRRGFPLAPEQRHLAEPAPPSSASSTWLSWGACSWWSWTTPSGPTGRRSTR
jgi:MoxR-like ATPase